MKLKRFQKDNKKNKMIIGAIIVLTLLICGIVLYRSYALYEEKKSYNVLNGTIPDFSKKCESGKTWNFEYIGSEQKFKVPCDGNYKIELWGAQGGGSSSYIGGLGGYTSGDINLKKDKLLYLYIGESGSNNNKNIYNNGKIIAVKNGSILYPGGGSTDIRYFSDTPTDNDLLWNSFIGIKSRIMVASGGSGANLYFKPCVGAAGGGLEGYNGTTLGDMYGFIPTGGTQTSGGLNGSGWWTATNKDDATKTYGHFGFVSFSDAVNTGGGNGYYAGGMGAHGSATIGSGGGGSSFISGHDGCDAIDESSTEDNIIHTGQSIHYNGLKFKNTVMIDGAGYSWTNAKGTVVGMPTHNGTSTMTGNSGNGYAKITYLGEETISVGES